MKIADFDGGTGTGVPDVDAAICGGTLSPLGLTITVMLLLNLKKAFGGKAPATHLDRSMDLQSRRANEKARPGMYVRFAIITGNLSLSIWKKLAEIERSS